MASIRILHEIGTPNCSLKLTRFWRARIEQVSLIVLRPVVLVLVLVVIESRPGRPPGDARGE